MSPTTSPVVAGVIGSPVQHSLSPVIHNAAFAAMELNWTYLALETPAGQGGAAVDAMRVLGMGGLSVTMPLKAEVAAAVDTLSPQAALLGAVNCVARSEGTLVGHNTDGAGFVDAFLATTGSGVQGLRCLVLGAGGAARAVVLGLASAGAAEVGVWNRTPARAAEVAALAGRTGTVVTSAGRSEAVARADLLVNATSVGMDGTAGAGELPLDPQWLRSGQFVSDLIYHPHDTPLLMAARESGAIPVHGVGMLIHQAAHQLRLWTNREPPLAVITAAVEQALAR